MGRNEEAVATVHEYVLCRVLFQAVQTGSRYPITALCVSTFISPVPRCQKMSSGAVSGGCVVLSGKEV